MSIERILDRVNDYLKIPSVVGHEERFFDFLVDDFSVSGYDVKLFNDVLVVEPKNPAPLIVSAHIDRHGIVVNEEKEFEYAAFNAKRIYRDVIDSTEGLFKKIGPRFVGESVVAYDDSGIIGEGRVIGSSYDFDKKKILFDIEELDRLPEGTALGYKSELQRRDGLVEGQLDNAISVAVLNELVREGFEGKIILSTEEEIGRSWKQLLSYIRENGFDNEVVVADTSPYKSLEDFSEGQVVLRDSDDAGKYDSSLISKLTKRCSELDIPHLMKSVNPDPNKVSKSYTEIGHIMKETNGKVKGATVQLPIIDNHTNHEITTEKAVENYYNVLKNLVA